MGNKKVHQRISRKVQWIKKIIQSIKGRIILNNSQKKQSTSQRSRTGWKGTLKTKLFTLLLLTAIVPVLFSSFVLYWQSKKNIEELIQENIDNCVSVVEYQLQQKSIEAVRLAKRCADDEEMINALKMKDLDLLEERVGILYFDLAQEAGIQILEIGDERGIVLTRGHSKKAGDDKSAQASIQAALAGMKVTGFDSGMSGMAFRAITPAKSDERIGTIQVGFDDKFLIDISKTTSAGIDIYQGNELIQTSDTKKMNRIGKSLTDLSIFEEVSERGKVQKYEGDKIQLYYPLHNPMNTEVIGMICVNQDISAILNVKKQQIIAIFIILLLSFAASLVIAVVFSGNITKPIRRLIRLMGKIENGDLTDRIEIRSSRNEIDLLIQSAVKMSENLKQSIQRIKKISHMLMTSSEDLFVITEENTKASDQVAESIQRAANGTQTQMQQFEEIEAAMQEMGSGIEGIAQSSAAVTKNAENTLLEAKGGNQQIKNIIHQMQGIQQVVADSSSSVQNLSKQSQQIDQILEAIYAITSQINLLSLNAAIEAARAGEHGRGFAVVADEVRKLAEQSEKSTSEIRNIIHEIRAGTNHSVSLMQAVTKSVQEGMKVANESGESFERILVMIQDVSSQIQGVSATIDEISHGAQQISVSVVQTTEIAKDFSSSFQNVAAVSEEQLASMEEIAAASEGLKDRAEELNQWIHTYTIE